MVFNSFTYIFFLIPVVILYWTLGRTGRLWLLLCSSIIFYGFWSFAFVPLLFTSIVIDYFAALFITRMHNEMRRRALLFLSLFANFSLLIIFKYYYFIAENVSVVSRIFGSEYSLPAFEILLPIGISFYTFQSVSYTIDVFRGNQKRIDDFLLFANYVIFFPQLVAGPILRASEVIWQLDERPKLLWERIQSGAIRILCGLALKVLLADNIADFVNQGFASNPERLSMIDVTTLAFLFGFQIYFDFAAYSHIALGSARLMGIEFPENFNFPYSASSPRDFWRRWHISLSSWIRDYLYLPLLGVKPEASSSGGITVNRLAITQRRAALALLVTWSIMGLWHGAAWTFIIWGIWHAVLILLYRFAVWSTRGVLLPKAMVGLGSVVSLFLLMLGWLPFRAESMSDVAIMLNAFIEPDRWFFIGMRENTYLVASIVFLITLAGPFVWASALRIGRTDSILAGATVWASITGLLATVLLYLRPLDQFIYFQF